MRKFTMLIMLMVIALTPGQTQPKKIKMHNSAKTMKQELEKLIPIGSSVTNAQQLLQANGFTCSMKQQKSFIEMKENKSVVEYNNIDFLFCEKRDHLPINTRLRQVAVVHKNGVVSDLLNSVDTSPVLRKKDYIRMSDVDIRKVLLKYAPLGSSAGEVKRMLRDVFHRGCKKDSYEETYPCHECSSGQGGFVFESVMQHYNRRILEVNYVWAVWYFDKNGILKELTVTHEWDGV